jgi:head-tail adaptor
MNARRERLVVLTSTPADLAVSTLTRSGAVATLTTAAPHGYATGDYATVAGATPAAYNGKVKVTVTGDQACTYAIAGSPTTPATGTITATYASDAQGGREETWRTVDTIAAEQVEIRATERLQLQAVSAQVDYRFRARVRSDLTPKMRILWTPSWPASAARKTLEIQAVRPEGDGRGWMVLDAGEAA